MIYNNLTNQVMKRRVVFQDCLKRAGIGENR